ncbi:MAG: sigma-70 family RNA polymerase sigma factor [Planctomycetales bacterium]|nr:sigma-70 family RNA polymerase sigma factor [Planctomycetales bacterium]
MPVLETQPTERNEVADLVRAAQQGNRDAFGELFERFERHVMAIAVRRLGDHGDAQELCQEVFIQAMLKIDQLRTPECFGGWLRSITNRMAINRIVRRGPTFSSDPEVMEATCLDYQTPLAQAMAGERSTQVRAGLARLREMDRETLEAFYIQQRSLRQMSDEFNAPMGTIKRRLHVARKRLSDEVKELVSA